jgi:hypothetical protein
MSYADWYKDYLAFREQLKKEINYLKDYGTYLYVNKAFSIGQLNPTCCFYVSGNANIAGTTTIGDIVIGNNPVFSGKNGIYSTLGDEVFIDYSPGSVVFNIAENIYSNLNVGSKFVGIGISKPEQKLHVASGNTLIDNNKFYQGKFSPDTGGNANNIAGFNQSDELVIASNDTKAIKFQVDEITDAFIMDLNGYFGIGVDPEDSLDILDGNIHVQSGDVIVLGTEDGTFNSETDGNAGTLLGYVPVYSDGYGSDSIGMGAPRNWLDIKIKDTIYHVPAYD